MKLRLSATLYARARSCADEVNEPLTHWVELALRMWQSGKLPPVAHAEIAASATEDTSTVMTLRPIPGCDAATIRAALLAAVQYCEARRPPPFATPLREGRDYLVARDDG